MLWPLLVQLILQQATTGGSTCKPAYNVTDFIQVAGIQFCAVVEIGQGFCSIFAEMRNDPTAGDLIPGSLVELYLGTCSCQTMKQWEFCSRPLRNLRPYECSFQEKGEDFTTHKSRVHRRLCDLTVMAEINSCNCRKKLSQRTLYPIEGFPTCYRNPLPGSVCSTHSVCGVYGCSARTVLGLTVVKCDENCFGGQPFCEEPGLLSSLPVVVTSIWSNWTCILNDDFFEISESICLEKDLTSPAFDCLGPRSLCCPGNYDECFCEVTVSLGEMKATRFIIKGYPQTSLYWQRKMKLKLIDNKLNIMDGFADDMIANKKRKNKKYSFIRKIKEFYN
ncbi:uncharacterized protein LOC106663261 isoform X2 [Cimex lectularius]|uniref:Uncharacterized protein n=1 Tax=Cimex lectularius TaxID=79782 RepID=A0A8I6RCB8_CIMLE|nr:uncharacterized protein LOC106663261 isoform X2 [Cimex lectularius]